MAYHLVWEETNMNKGLHLYPDVLEGYTLVADTPSDLYPLAYRSIRAGHLVSIDYMYYCRHCQGWIEGSPSVHYNSSMTEEGALVFEGQVYHCKRCGNIIGRIDY